MAKKKKSKAGKTAAPIEQTEPFFYPEGDAHTLANAEAIRRDPARMNAASAAAKKMVKEQTDQLSGLKKVANKKPLKGKK